MTLASWFSSLRHSRRPARVGARRDRRRAPRRRASFDALEGRALLSTTVSFGAPSESLDGSSGGFTISVSLSSPPSGTPIVSPFASINGPGGLAFDSAGNLYAADSGDGTVDKVTPAGTVSTYASGFNDPVAVAVRLRRQPLRRRQRRRHGGQGHARGGEEHLRLRVEPPRRA